VKSARRADEFFYRFELPITYAERKYGETNISRWTHGTILLVMLMFAARRIKFI
jgi:hypothetical protein